MTGSDNPHQVAANPHQVTTNPHQVTANPPEELMARIQAAGSKPRQEALRAMILDLCTWRPCSARELASWFGRTKHKHLVRDHLTPMVADGQLAYTIPEMENHPDQRYTVAPKK